MPDLSRSLPLPPLDLTAYTEATRRELYDRLVMIQFTAPDPATVEHPEDVWVPEQTPDQAGLTIFYLFGRWFAFWRDVPEPGLPEWRMTELVRLEADPSSPFGVMLHEV
jgi:hypothetical protein